MLLHMNGKFTNFSCHRNCRRVATRTQKRSCQGRIQGVAHPARALPKIGKNMIFWRKIVIFHTKYPNNFRASLRNWKRYDFLASNRDFSHEIHQKFSRLPPLEAIFLSAPPPNLKSWIRPCLLNPYVVFR